MSSSRKIITALVDVLGRLLSTRPAQRDEGDRVRPARPRATLRPNGVAERRRTPRGEERRPTQQRDEREPAAGRMPGTQTVQVDPERVRDVSVGYSPTRNRLPDSGEVIWTWVPYEENDGRGKDRPVLVIGRHDAQRVYAVRMTSRAHDGDRDFIGIGSGDWDAQGRPSWVDIEQLYSVHHDGMRREAAVLDAGRYARVAEALIARYGWARA